MRSIRHTFLLLVLVCSGFLSAEEVKYIDLTSIQQRTELRTPPSPPMNCGETSNCLGGGWSGGSVTDGAPDFHDPHALGVFLLRVTPTDFDPEEPFEAEFRVQNTGLAPVDIPVSPHLSDLQPDDDSESFSYLSIALVVRGESEPQRPGRSSLGFVELYGSAAHEGSILVLKPGEWIRVRANVKLRTWPTEPSPARLRGEFWLRKNTFHPHPGGSSSEIHNLYPNVTSTPPVSVYLIRPRRSEAPAN